MSRAALLLTMALASCASHQHFRPREATMVASPSGYLAAQYALGEEDSRVGRINVWSDGAWQDGRRTVIHLGLEVTNTSDQTLSVDAEEVELRSLATETRTIDVLTQSAIAGRIEIPPEQVGSVDFEFLTDQDVSPTALLSFAARWVVLNERDGMYRNLTLFQADDSYHYGYRAYPYYYGYWGYPYGRWYW